MLDFMKNMEKQYEVKAMRDVILKESAMLGARAETIQQIAQGEIDPLKVIEYCAEVAMIGKLIDTLESMSEETISEAERLNMIEK